MRFTIAKPAHIWGQCLPLFIFVFGTLLSTGLPAQKLAYLGSGYNVGYTRVDSLNYIIRRYNESNVLTRAMPGIHVPNGLNFSAGVMLNKVLIDLSWVGKHQTSRSRGIDAGNNSFGRDVKLRFNSINAAVGYNFFSNGKQRYSAGASFDFSFVRAFLREGRIDQLRQSPWILEMNEATAANTVFLQVLLASENETGVAIILRPFYQFHWNKPNYFLLNQDLNPTLWFNDPPVIRARPSNFGVMFITVFYLAGS